MFTYSDEIRNQLKVIERVIHNLNYFSNAFYATGNEQMGLSFESDAEMLKSAKAGIEKALSDSLDWYYKESQKGTAQTLKFALEMPKLIDHIKEETRQEMNDVT